MLQFDGLLNQKRACGARTKLRPVPERLVLRQLVPGRGSHAKYDKDIRGMSRKDIDMNFPKSIAHAGFRQLFRKASESQATPARSATLSNGELKQIVAAMLG